MIEFGGWWMPVQYAGILQEHRAVRERAGLFDLSHMGEIEVRGPSALETLHRVATNDVARLRDGAALYTPLCLPSGGIVDDVVIYRHSPDRYLLVVNAANTEKDYRWLREHARGSADVEDVSAATALLALQGPVASDILQTLTDARVDSLEYFTFLPTAAVAGVPVLLSRTGYTGERGYELFCDAADAVALWDALCNAVTSSGGGPVGLGARDTLRLEARYLLYGNDIDEGTSPLEAGLGWAVAFDKGEFLGRAALLRQRDVGVSRRLAGFRMVDRAVARSGCAVWVGGSRVGAVTSGAPSPTTGGNIGLAYVERAYAAAGTSLEVEIRGRRHPSEVVPTPFYRPRTR
jgi:aminomethyltransferase